MLPDVIERYHALLSRGRLASDSHDLLTRLQAARGLMFGSRPVCNVIRPRFLSLADFRFLRTRVETLLPAFQKAYERALADPVFRQQFRLNSWEEQLLEIEPGFRCPSPTSRFDSFFISKSELKFTEYNTETPAGAGYSDALTKLFFSLPIFDEFQQSYHVHPLPCQPSVTHALLKAFNEWQGTRNAAPQIAILDWREVPTFSEFVLFYDYFHSIGITARNVDPREVEYVNGKLMCGDYHITLIYKRVLISELIERGGMDHPVVRAVRDGAVCMVNTFRCKILFKKASFAVVSDERNQSLFTPDELQAIHDHIPWTRVVEERKTVWNGQPIDLIPHICAHKDQFVLKPNDEYGGKGIVLGWTVDQATWDHAVASALAAPYVVQQRISLPKEGYPSVIDGHVHVADRLVDTNPYVVGGDLVQGCLTRISTDELVNVTAGGGSTVPTFLVEER